MYTLHSSKYPRSRRHRTPLTAAHNLAAGGIGQITQQYLISQRPHSLRYCSSRTAMELSRQKDRAHRMLVQKPRSLGTSTWYCIQYRTSHSNYILAVGGTMQLAQNATLRRRSYRTHLYSSIYPPIMKYCNDFGSVCYKNTILFTLRKEIRFLPHIFVTPCMTHSFHSPCSPMPHVTQPGFEPRPPASLMQNFCSGTCEQTTFSTLPSIIHTKMVLRVRKEHRSFPPRPSTIHCIGSCTCAKRTPFFSTPSLRHTYIILAPVRVRKEHRSFPPRPSTMKCYWLRYVCEKCGAGPVACNYSDPAHQSPPRPTTMQYYWLTYE